MSVLLYQGRQMNSIKVNVECLYITLDRTQWVKEESTDLYKQVVLIDEITAYTSPLISLGTEDNEEMPSSAEVTAYNTLVNAYTEDGRLTISCKSQPSVDLHLMIKF